MPFVAQQRIDARRPESWNQEQNAFAETDCDDVPTFVLNEKVRLVVWIALAKNSHFQWVALGSQYVLVPLLPSTDGHTVSSGCFLFKVNWNKIVFWTIFKLVPLLFRLFWSICQTMAQNQLFVEYLQNCINAAGCVGVVGTWHCGISETKVQQFDVDFLTWKQKRCWTGAGKTLNYTTSGLSGIPQWWTQGILVSFFKTLHLQYQVRITGYFGTKIIAVAPNGRT